MHDHSKNVFTPAWLAPLGSVVCLVVLLFGSTRPATADSFSPSVFATGTAIGATNPDSVEYADGSIWIAYKDNGISTGGGILRRAK